MKLIIEIKNGAIHFGEIAKVPKGVTLKSISFSHLVSGIKRLLAGVPFFADIAPVEVTNAK